MTVSIYNTDTNGYPTTLKYALTAPSTIPYASTIYFSAPTGATLDAGTALSDELDRILKNLQTRPLRLQVDATRPRRRLGLV